MAQQSMTHSQTPASAGLAPALVDFPCSTCGAALRSPAKLIGKQGRCHVCGSVVVVTAPAPTPAENPATAVTRKAGRVWHLPAGRLLLYFVAIVPPVFLVAISWWTGFNYGLHAQRIAILNQVFVALYAYCVLAGGFKPHVIGRVYGIDLDRRQILLFFTPGLLVSALLAILTFKA